MRTSEVLNKAADLIEQRGWGTGKWFGDGPLCIEGAIAAASGLTGLDAVLPACPARYAVEDFLGCTAFAWNDHLKHSRVSELILAPDRPQSQTLEDIIDIAVAEGQAKVVEVLRATAVIEEARAERTAILAEPVGVA